MFQIQQRNIQGNVKRAPAALFKRISTLVGHLTWKVLTELCRVPQTRRTNNVEIFQLSDRGITSPSIVATNDQPNLSLPPDVKNCKPEPEPHQHGSRLPELGTRNSELGMLDWNSGGRNLASHRATQASHAGIRVLQDNLA